MSKDVKINTHSVFNAVRDKIPQYINNLMSLPQWPVWMHEASLYRIIMPSRDSYETFGRIHVLTSIINTISDGQLIGLLQRLVSELFLCLIFAYDVLSFDLQIKLTVQSAAFSTDHTNCNRIVDAMSMERLLMVR